MVVQVDIIQFATMSQSFGTCPASRDPYGYTSSHYLSHVIHTNP